MEACSKLHAQEDHDFIITLFQDANDESLQRYKESLGLSTGATISDPSDPRVCIILSLTMESAGRAPVTIDLSAKGSEATLKDKPFKIKEGARFNMVVKFKVQHDVLSGLQYVQIVKRKGIRVSKDQEMIVSIAAIYTAGANSNSAIGIIRPVYRKAADILQEM